MRVRAWAGPRGGGRGGGGRAPRAGRGAGARGPSAPPGQGGRRPRPGHGGGGQGGVVPRGGGGGGEGSGRFFHGNSRAIRAGSCPSNSAAGSEFNQGLRREAGGEGGANALTPRCPLLTAGRTHAATSCRSGALSAAQSSPSVGQRSDDPFLHTFPHAWHVCTLATLRMQTHTHTRRHTEGRLRTRECTHAGRSHTRREVTLIHTHNPFERASQVRRSWMSCWLFLCRVDPL